MPDPLDYLTPKPGREPLPFWMVAGVILAFAVLGVAGYVLMTLGFSSAFPF